MQSTCTRRLRDSDCCPGSYRHTTAGWAAFSTNGLQSYGAPNFPSKRDHLLTGMSISGIVVTL